MALFDPYQDQTQGLKLPEMPADPAPKKGLFSSLGGLLAKADAADANGLNFWDRLGNVSASLRDDPAYRQMAYEQNAAKTQSYKKDALQRQALEQANAQADGLGLQGRERLVFMANPEAWAKENATRYGVTNVAPGSLATNAGANGESIYNPKTAFEGQYATATNPDGSIRITGERPMTYDEQNAQARLTRPDYQAFNPDANVMQVNPYAAGAPVGQQPGYTPSGALPPADAVAPLLSQAIPGLRITGMGRDPSRNAQVGGVKNSMHLDNNAIDMVLPPGVTPDQVVAHLRSQGIEPTEVLNEGQVGNQGAHLHVGWRPKGQQAAQPQQNFTPQMVQRGAPKATVRPATAAEKAAYGIPADVPAQMKPDGSVDVISGIGANNRRVPATVGAGYIANRAALSDIDNAINLIKENPNALGLKNIAGDMIMQRHDPKGEATRNALGALTTQQIHDLSGAAVAASEYKRLRIAVPDPTDTASAAISKLQARRAALERYQSQIEQQYGEDQGYAPLVSNQPSQRQATNSALKAKSSGKEQFIAGQVYTDADGNSAIYRGNGEWEEQ